MENNYRDRMNKKTALKRNRMNKNRKDPKDSKTTTKICQTAKRETNPQQRDENK